jgi:PhnO protein
MIVRDAVEKDAATLGHLLAQLGYPTSIDESTQRITHYKQTGYKLLVAEIDNMVIGFIALHWYRAIHHPELIGRVVAFCMDEPYRSKGWGSQLLAHAEDFFQDLHCMKIELTSNLRRKESHQYYLRKGYEQRSIHFVKFLLKE